MEYIKLSLLVPHPGNPRLAPRAAVVAQIVAQLNGKMDEAHALIVRPMGKQYQIVNGHLRALVAEKAGLTAVPCVEDSARPFCPFEEIQDAVLMAFDCGIADRFTLSCKQTVGTVGLALRGGDFIGEYVCPPSIQYLRAWFP